MSNLEEKNKIIFNKMNIKPVWREPEIEKKKIRLTDDLIKEEEEEQEDVEDILDINKNKDYNIEERKINILIKIRDILKKEKLEDEITYDNLINIYELFFVKKDS